MRINKVLIVYVLLFHCFNVRAQNSPFLIWGSGLDGSTYQTAAIYSFNPAGLAIEAPLDWTGLKLPIQLGWRGGDNAMKILSNGNVGVGTLNPTAKLSVNGNIRAREIKVENANWPDYVFAKSYQLPSLQGIEKYIKEMGHLPGIPSAAEVKAEGIDLGEMNAKLLQKIEELTLYLIEMKKENRIQQKFNNDQNQILRAEINALKSKP